MSLFISDLHLTAERPLTHPVFFRFLREVAPQAQALYILGDFFEAWVGDDALAEPFHAQVAQALRRLTGQGVAVHLMHGNRDFLLAQAFCAASDARLIAEPHVLDLAGVPTVLLHGDALCIDDVDYQGLRRMVRDAQWQAAFLQRPYAERVALAQQLRAQSERSKGDKPPEIMDVNVEAVAEAFRRHGVRRMIHGHTHRPGHHVLTVDGVACERWVLPDWYATGGYLACDAAGCRLVSLGP
ncbi:MAG: UDP-2,3-diacylglucosamine diphosphatase [Thiobacillaceae bacterium]|nr:UDP-2,3-diacylglucosamine diphosphatase [Thiobacillaceae bacterium]MCX7672074.1 UDP-2,3-diacylglucosamine diphosphatase [Thiobacillaceae bacterium]MDW8324333.1 UDP-2,3-diacylglucosamine diphosphatase [Burkholderiales bacterium]